MPYDLRDFTLSDTIRCGKDLRQIIQESPSLESAAEAMSEFLYESVVDGETGKPSCAMVRAYKTHSYGSLPADLQGFARNVLKRKPASPNVKCLTLLGTAGSRPEWNSRRRSST